MKFASDNWAGADPDIVAAVAEAAKGFAPAYGSDPISHQVEEAFNGVFEREVSVFFVGTGTAANALSIAALARPGGLVFCHDEAHINTDEGGAPEYQSSNKMVGVPGAAGKMTPGGLQTALDRFPPNPVRHGQPVAVSISQLTELGAAYTPDEIAALVDVARRAGLGVHMDGARFGNAVAATGSSPAELSWRAGIDIMSFGGTKNGCLGAEAVVIFDKRRTADFPYLRKRAGHLISKSRFVAAQFQAYLEDDRWLRLAEHANRMAATLADGIAVAGGSLAWAADGNEVFAFIPTPTVEAMRAAGATFYDWHAEGMPPQPGDGLVRLVTSFATTEAEVDQFCELLCTS